MKAKELTERFRAFSRELQEHQRLWGSSLSSSWMADGIVRHHEAVFAHQRELVRMLAVLDPFINRYALSRVIGGYGQTWDIFGSSTTDDHPIRKARSLQEAIQQVDGIIARLELEQPERDIPERMTETAAASQPIPSEAFHDDLVPFRIAEASKRNSRQA